MTDTRYGVTLDGVLATLDDDARASVMPLAAAVLRTAGGFAAGPDGAIESVAAVLQLADRADEAMRTAVSRARSAGRSWTEIGSALGISRQSAFQRYARTGAGMPERQSQQMRDRATELFVAMAAGDFDGVRASFDERMARSLDADRLGGVWANVTGMVGLFERLGRPVARPVGDCVVVDVPLQFEAGEMVGRVSFDRDDRVAGLFVLNPQAVQ